MTIADNHNHILLARITEMLAAAKTKRISDFSITEHVSQFRELRESIRFGSIHPNGRIFDGVKEYNEEFGKIDQAAYSGMKINRGLEVDFSPRFENGRRLCQSGRMGHPSLLRPRIRGRKRRRKKR